MQKFMMSTRNQKRIVADPRGTTRRLLVAGHNGLVFLLVACMLGRGDCQGEGLFPPTRLGRNLAPFNRVQATSVCGETEEGVGQLENYCAPDGSLRTCRERICDGECLYESRISNGLDVLAEGTLRHAVVSFHNIATKLTIID